MLFWSALWLAYFSIFVLAQVDQLFINHSLRDYNKTNVEMLKDVAYGTAHPAQKLDVYLPPDGTAFGPATIIFIHGGAWRS